MLYSIFYLNGTFYFLNLHWSIFCGRNVQIGSLNGHGVPVQIAECHCFLSVFLPGPDGRVV